MSGSPGRGLASTVRRIHAYWTPRAAGASETVGGGGNAEAQVLFKLKKGQRILSVCVELITAGDGTTGAITAKLATATTALLQSVVVSSNSGAHVAGDITDSTAAFGNQSGGKLATADDNVAVEYAFGDTSATAPKVLFIIMIRQDIP